MGSGGRINVQRNEKWGKERIRTKMISKPQRVKGRKRLCVMRFSAWRQVTCPGENEFALRSLMLSYKTKTVSE